MTAGSFFTAITADIQEVQVHDKHKKWITDRGLDPTLAEKLGVATILKNGANWITVPYLENGKLVNRKYRLTTEKRHQMEPGADLLLWNCDVLKDQSMKTEAVVITEGEWDAIAAIQAGFSRSVSVPNGAPGQLTEDLDTATRYNWFDRHHKELSEVKTFILATDGDEAGQYLAADLVALLGAERCKFVSYPEHCKDLNEVLHAYGESAVATVINQAKPVPVKGLYSLSDFPEKADVRYVEIGIDAIRDYIKIVPGTLTVFTGYANMGKSTVMNEIIAGAMRNFPVCIASFETDVKPILRDGLRKVFMSCSTDDMRRIDFTECDAEMEPRLKIITQAVDEELEMGLDEFLDMCRVSVVRDGVKMIVLDPWNELEHKRRRDEAETDYISRALRQIKRFAKQYDVAFWIVAHPTKPHEGSKKVPGLYDISGSANWANKADYGLTYHRPDPEENDGLIIINKVRMGLPGQKGKVRVMFDYRDSHFKALNG